MREIDFLDALGKVDETYIEECVTYRKPKKAQVWIRRIGAVAACFVLVIAAVLVVHHLNQPVILDENGFYIENGVLLRYTGSETDITIPEEVETIADFTFLDNQNAGKIEVVRLGTRVQTVGVNAFAGLDHLSDLIIAESNPSFVYADGLVLSADGTVLLRYARTGETSFTIPESVRFVAAHAVQGTELEEIDFGEHLECIGYNAFASNYRLKAIFLPDSVQYICEGAFSGCSAAVDGHIPDGVEYGGEAFDSVPFYLSLKAGQTSPLEEVRRGQITPSEAVLKSDLESLTVQIEYILATLRGEEYEADDAAMFATGAVHDHPEVPENMQIPGSFTLDDLTFKDSGWGSTSIYDLQIFLPAGDYILVMQAYAYDLYDALYWENVRFRISNVYYMQNPDTAEPDDTVSAFGWTAVFGRNGQLYRGITYTHEDGRILHSFLPAESEVPYVLTFSPDGTRVAVEYSYGGCAYFYVQSLNGDVLMEPNYDYNEYLNRYYGQYTAGTLAWVDNDNIEGENEFGRFRYNIYEFQVTQIGEAPVEGSGTLEVAPCNSVKVSALPKATGEARIAESAFMGSPVIYVFDDDLRFFVHYLDTNGSGTLYACDLSLPDGYTDGRITGVGRRGSGEIFIYVSATVRGSTGTLSYLFFCGGGLPQLEEVRTADTDPSARPEVTSIETDLSGFLDVLAEMGESDTFPPYAYDLSISGLPTDVCFRMRAYDSPESLTAFGQTVAINERVHLYGNCGVDLFVYGGAVIFTWDYYDIGYVYILGDGFSEVIEPGDAASVKLYPDENGKLCYKRTNNHIADIIQTGGLSAATGYDDFLYCIGSASIENGKLVLGDAEESYTIGDKYDLDREFAENGFQRYYTSIEEVFADNRELPGYAEPRLPAITRLLSMTVAELRTTYGALHLEYSEHGPGQPVYSMANFPGVLLVFHRWEMDDPLPEDRMPDELIVTEDYGRAIHALTVGTNVEDGREKPDWSGAEYSVINGTVNLKAVYDRYTVTYTVSGQGLSLPQDDTEADWKAWEEEYLQNPTGKIVQIRLELNR